MKKHVNVENKRKIDKMDLKEAKVETKWTKGRKKKKQERWCGVIECTRQTQK